MVENSLQQGQGKWSQVGEGVTRLLLFTFNHRQKN